MEIINLKVDVTKISKSRLFKGEKGTYLNCSLIPTPESQYGDYMIVEDVTKEEREAGTKGVILGNGKVFKRKETPKDEPKSEPAKSTSNESDDLPF